MPDQIFKAHLKYAVTHWGVGLVLTCVFSVALWTGASIIAFALDRNTAAFDRNTLQLHQMSDVVKQGNEVNRQLGDVFDRARNSIQEGTEQSKVNGDLLKANRIILLRLEDARQQDERERSTRSKGDRD